MNFRLLLKERNELEKRIQEIDNTLKEQKLYMVNIITVDKDKQIHIKSGAYKTFKKAKNKFCMEMMKIINDRKINISQTEIADHFEDDNFCSFLFSDGEINIEEVYIEE